MLKILISSLWMFVFSLNVTAQNQPPRSFLDIESAKNTSQCVWFLPNASPGKVGKHQSLELGFKLPTSMEKEVSTFLSKGTGGINPFDPDELDFTVTLASPTNKEVVRFAFYYQPYRELLYGNAGQTDSYKNEFVKDTTSFPWRFRFCPDEIGNWTISLRVKVKGVLKFEQQGINFVCESSEHKGPLRVSKEGKDTDRWMYYEDTNEPFFAIAENISSGGFGSYLPSQNRRQLEGVQKLISAGGNYTRFELGAQAALPDWPVIDNYNGKLDEMYAFDRVLRLCEEFGVYFTLFRHHVEVMDGEDWEPVRWELNPYKSAFTATIEDYFTNEDILKAQKKTLRYIFARWGYSTNMAAYSYSEVDNWYKKANNEYNAGNLSLKFKVTNVNKALNNEVNAASLLRNWIYKQQKFIHDSLNPTTLFCHSYASVGRMEDFIHYSSFYSISDFVGPHNYGMDKDRNYGNRAEQVDFLWKLYKKPVLIEEMGPSYIALNCCTGVEFHNSVWSTSFMGGMGTGMDWWWDGGVFDMGYESDLRNIQLFFSSEDLKKGNFSPQKWDDVMGKGDRAARKRKLENYALVSEDKERILGWVHNATYYWRNLENENSCLHNLIANKTTLNEPCYFAEDPFAHPYQKGGSAPQPWNHNDVYDHEPTHVFNDKRDKDAYTDEGGARKLKEGKSFKISGLKRSWLGRKQTYQITFYATSAFALPVASEANATQIRTSNCLGRLRIVYPYSPQGNAQPDYAYKIVWVKN